MSRQSVVPRVVRRQRRVPGVLTRRERRGVVGSLGYSSDPRSRQAASVAVPPMATALLANSRRELSTSSSSTLRDCRQSVRGMRR